MALSEVQQLQKILEGSKHILLVFNSADNGDAVAAALALKKFFDKQHRQAEVACSDFKGPKHLRFLPEIESVQPGLANLQKFIIKIDLSKVKLDTLSYDIKDSSLNIYLTPKQGLITKNELRTARSTFKYDLIITLNTPDLESLGKIYSNNTDLFFRTPIVNIDHLPNNERYGHVNVVDLSATSTSEIVHKIVKQLGEQHLDAELATVLLTGMTLATGSFKNPNVSPFTLQAASELISRGAERERIVQNLYRTRSLSTLKLWGQALTHLQGDQKLGLIWTTITREDFSRSGGNSEELKGVIDELLRNSPEAKVILLLYEFFNNPPQAGQNNPPQAGQNNPPQVGGYLATEKNFDALRLLESLHPQGTKNLAHFSLSGKTLKEAEQLTIELLTRQILK